MSPHLYTILGSVFRLFPAVGKKKPWQNRELEVCSMDGGAGLAVFDPDPALQFLMFKKISPKNMSNTWNISLFTPCPTQSHQAITRSRGFAVSTRCLFDVCG